MTTLHMQDAPAHGSEGSHIDPDDGARAAAGVHASGARGDTSYLPAGTRLGGFELLGLVGPGRSGPVYRACDLASGELLVIKEFMPAGLATRSDWRVGAVLPERQAEYGAALQCFVDDAQWLAQIGHPALVPVQEVWLSHGTACAVLPLAGGGTLLAHLARATALKADRAARDGVRGSAAAIAPTSEPTRAHAAQAFQGPDERWLQQLLTTLGDALGCLHDAGRLHRGLSPNKVLFSAGGKAQLLALGLHPLLATRPLHPSHEWRDAASGLHVAHAVHAAHAVDAAHAAHASLRPGFSALESYPPQARVHEAAGELQEGPWTDIYALGALAYCAITGEAPKPAPQRGFGDTAGPLVRLARGRYDERLLDAVDRALALWPNERPQSCADFLELAGLAPVPHALGGLPGSPALVASRDGAEAALDASAPIALATADVHADVAAAAAKVDAAAAAAAAATASSPEPRAALPGWRKRVLLPLALGASLLMATAAGALLQSRGWMPVWLAGQPQEPVSAPAAKEPPVAHSAAALAAARVARPASAATMRVGPRTVSSASRPVSAAASATVPAAARKERCAELLAQLSLGGSPSAAQLERLKTECP